MVIRSWSAPPTDDDNDADGSGSVYVFIKDTDGVWNQTKLTASDAATDDGFGRSVGVDGDTIVVGAPGDDDNDADGSGSVYVFIKDTDGVWNQTKLTASDAADSDEFGQSVGIDGDTIVVGVPYDDDNNARDSGSVYVFTKDTEGVWNQTKLTASDAADSDEFGQLVGIDGDTIVVGVPYDDDNNDATDSGSVYVFTKDSDGVWNQTKLTASDAADSDEFGQSVGIDGDTIVVGVPYDDDDDGGHGSGSVYVFIKDSEGVWNQTAKLTASDAAPYDRFGTSVGVDGDTIVVGDPYDDPNNKTNAGSVYVLDVLSGWAEIPSSDDETVSYTVTGLTNDVSYVFGVRAVNSGDYSHGSDPAYAVPATVPAAPAGLTADPDDKQVGLSWDDPNDALITKYQYSTDGGANYTDIPGSNNATVSYMVTGLTSSASYTLGVRAVNDTGAGGGSTITTRVLPPQPADVVATGGDTQVSLSWTDPGDSAISGYEVWQAELAKLVASDAATSDYFGGSVGIDGDTVVVGAPGDDDNDADGSGSVYVFTKDSDGVWNQTKLTASDAAASDWFGGSVGIDGDTIVVGAPYDDDNDADGSGSVYVFTKDSDGVWNQTKLTASDAATSDYFGGSVGIDGDTIVVGAPEDDDNDADGSGSVYVFTKDSGGVWNQTKLTASDATSYDWFGGSVGIDGDTIVVGAPYDDDNDADGSGSVYVFSKDSDGVWNQTKLTASDAATSDYFGGSVGIDGDTIVVGAPRDDDSASGSGSVYVFSKDSGGVWNQTKLTASDPAPDNTVVPTIGRELFGSSVGIDGDTIGIGALYWNYWSNGQLESQTAERRSSVYVFTKDTSGVWNQTKLVASDAAVYDRFGWSVGVDGDRIVVGAPRDDDNDATDSGSVYVLDVLSGWAEIPSSDDETVSYTVTGLTNYVSYVLWVRAVNSSDYSHGSDPVYAVPATVPAAPAGLSAVAGDEQATLSWTDPDNFTITKYEYSIDGGTNYVEISGSDAATVLFTVTGLSSGVSYTFAIRAVNHIGVGVGAMVVKRVLPAQPAGFVAAGGNTQIDLSWDDPGDSSISSYQYQQVTTGVGYGAAWTTIPDSGAATVSYTITGLVNDTSYDSRIRAVNESGPGPETSTVTAIPAAAPAAPANLAAVAGDGEMALSWDDPTDASINKYEYSTDGGTNYINISGSDAATVSFTVTELNSGASYTFGIRAVNDTGDGVGSTVTERVLSDQPAGLAATGGNTQVSLSWDDPADSAISGYEWWQAELARVVASDAAASDWFGFSVGTDGDTMMVVGAPYDNGNNASDSGSVYVFTKDTDGVWSQAAKLVASDAATDDRFGYSVGTDGDTIVVGAYRDDDNDADDSGSVYVFTKPSDGWADGTETAKLVASDAADSDWFGWSVGIDGDTIAVGAPYDDDNDADGSGSVYVFTKDSDGAWNQAAKLVSSDAAAGDRLGWSVGIDGDTIVVGAYRDDDNDADESGSVYVFTKPSDGWADGTETAKLVASDAAADDRFGWSVGTDGDTIAVGAPFDDDDADGSGSVYVFAKPDGGWDDGTETVKLVASDAAAGDRLGWSVGTDGDTIAVGAPGDDDDGDDSGSVYVFTKDSNGAWRQAVKLVSSDAAAGDEFGWSVGTDSDTIVVGVYLDDDNADDSGSVHVVDVSSGWTEIPNSDNTTTSYTVTGLTNNVSYAFWVRAVNSGGDSLGSDPAHAVPAAAVPAAPAGLTAVAGDKQIGLSWTDPTDASIKKYQYSTDNSATFTNITAGDDQTTSYTVGGLDSGVEYTFLLRAVNDNGNSTTSTVTERVLPAQPTELVATGANTQVTLNWDDPNDTNITDYDLWQAELTKLVSSDAAASDRFGTSAGIDGDTMVVGAPRDDDAADDTGSIYVFTKDSNGVWNQTAKLTASDAATNDRFGTSVGIDGDTIVVGAPRDDDNDADDSGSVYVFVKPSDGWATTSAETAKLTASDAAADDRFGTSVGIDGTTVVVGAPGDDDNDADDSGSVYVFVKPAGAWATTSAETAKLTASDAAADDRFGTSVGIDGSTIVVGAPGDNDNNASDSGSVYVFTKDSNGVWNQTAKLTASDAAADDGFGTSVGIDGDTIVVGAPGDNDTADDTGSGYVYTKDSNGVWNQTAKLAALDAAAADGFGTSVGIDDDAIVVGAPGDDDNNADGSGSVYVFTKDSNGVWNQTKLTISHAAADDQLGGWVGIDGDTIVVGVPGDDDNADDSGSVYALDISSGWTEIPNSDDETVSYVVTGLTNYRRRAFWVRAVNSGGDSLASDPAHAVPAAAAPAAPAGLTAVAGDRQMGLSWTNPADVSITKYQYSTDAGVTYTDIDPSHPATSSFTVTGLTSSVSYTFGIRAVNDIGDGAGATVVKRVLPAQPTGLAATAGNTQITLSWTDPGDSNITGYEYQQVTTGAVYGTTWTTIPNSDDETVSYTITGLVNYTSYDSRIRAVNESGPGPATATATAIPVAALPETPTGLTADPGDKQVTLSWDDPDDVSINKYRYSIDAGATYTDIPGSDADTVWFTVGGLTSGASYTLGVRAVNDTGDSVGVTVTTRVLPAKLANFAATGGNTQVTLSWDDPSDSNITGYELWYHEFAKLVASDPATDDGFGSSVAVDGDTMVVGARYDDDAAYGSGSVYVFTKDPSGVWNQAAKLTASDPANSDYFGGSVGVDGDTIVVGARRDDHNNKTDAGSVYVFTKPSDGWADSNSETAKLTASDPAAGDRFGTSVGIDGDTVVVSARRDDHNNKTDAGSVYVFIKPSDGWADSNAETAKLTASDAAASDWFGSSVGVDGDTMVVGARRDDHNNITDAGSVYVFTKPSDGWADSNAETAKLTASDPANNDYFGESVGVDGDTIVVVAPNNR